LEKSKSQFIHYYSSFFVLFGFDGIFVFQKFNREMELIPQVSTSTLDSRFDDFFFLFFGFFIFMIFFFVFQNLIGKCNWNWNQNHPKRFLFFGLFISLFL
jgi:hypothetical protein